MSTFLCWYIVVSHEQYMIDYSHAQTSYSHFHPSYQLASQQQPFHVARIAIQIIVEKNLKPAWWRDLSQYLFNQTHYMDSTVRDKIKSNSNQGFDLIMYILLYILIKFLIYVSFNVISNMHELFKLLDIYPMSFSLLPYYISHAWAFSDPLVSDRNGYKTTRYMRERERHHGATQYRVQEHK